MHEGREEPAGGSQRRRTIEESGGWTIDGPGGGRSTSQPVEDRRAGRRMIDEPGGRMMGEPGADEWTRTTDELRADRT
jgi:hypothetical protein